MSDRLYPVDPVLLIDDEAAFLRSLGMVLKRLGGINHILHCEDSRNAMTMMTQHPVSLVILDLTMPYLSGETLLQELVEHYPEVPVIILSGLNQIDTAVRCIKQGAHDYFVKTTEQERLVAGIRRALSIQEMRQELSDLKMRIFEPDMKRPEMFAEFVTRHPRMFAIFRYIEAITKSSEAVLVTGESGTGKEMIARAIHQSSRPSQPWVAINVAGLDDTVFSDTLFGHSRGAFTGADRTRAGMIEKAGSGTLFLDEIGDLGMQSQIKLLRLLQENEYYPLGADSPKRSHARLVFATNVNLAESMAAGTFRKDLYYRLQTHSITIPPLRERPGDLSLLLKHFIEEAAQSMDKEPPTMPAELAVLLGAYDFPGNVRELRGMVYDAVGVHEKGILSMKSFQTAINKACSTQKQRHEGAAPNGSVQGYIEFPAQLPTLSEMADMLVREAMRRSQENQTIAARLLGITRQALGQRLKKHHNEKNRP